jgi:HSP20 family protein
MPSAPRRIPVEEAISGRRFVLRAELPGIDPDEDLRITCAAGELRLDVCREPAEHEGWRSEFGYGRRVRVVALPPGVRSHTLAARYADGVLEVSAVVGPVEPGPRPFRVAVE